jgi:hypothetical protein
MRKLHTQLFLITMNRFQSLRLSAYLLIGCTTAFLVLSSSDNGGTGVNNAAANGTTCNPCHGNTFNANTTIMFSGVPIGSYTPGTSYPVTLTINNPSMPKCGFSLYVTGGTLSGNPTGTTLTPVSFNQIRHNTPLPMTSGAYTCNFNWIAPAAGGTVTVKVVANAVNGNGTDDAGDQWNSAQFTLMQAPNTINQWQTEPISVYPNPASSTLMVDTKNPATISGVVVRTIAGHVLQVPIENHQGTLRIDINTLANGYYQIAYVQNGVFYQTAFIKK